MSEFLVRKEQKSKLYSLLAIKYQNIDIEIKGLEDEIVSHLAEMDESDIESVQNKISKKYNVTVDSY